MNKISSVKTIPVRGNEGSSSAIMVGLDIDELHSLESFLKEFSSTFTSQMMISPEDTNKMLITIIGNCSAQEFKEHWLKIVKTDPIIQYFMRKMIVADAMHGTADGQVLEQVSLLDASASPKQA